jgi:hypothetical protein
MSYAVRQLIEMRLKGAGWALTGALAIWLLEKLFSEHHPLVIIYLVMEFLGLIAGLVQGWRGSWTAISFLMSYILLTLIWMASVLWVSTRLAA